MAPTLQGPRKGRLQGSHSFGALSRKSQALSLTREFSEESSSFGCLYPYMGSARPRSKSKIVSDLHCVIGVFATIRPQRLGSERGHSSFHREIGAEMKSMLVSIVVALVGVNATSCAESSDHTSSTSRPATDRQVASTKTTSGVTPAATLTRADSDQDNDLGTMDDDSNNSESLDYGHPANTADKQSITTLVKHYYSAAFNDDGAIACSMLYSTVAEVVPEDYGESPPGPPYMVGKTCPAVMALLFKHYHKQLAIELPLLKVARVRLQEHHGQAILTFGSLPERQISVTREGDILKIAEVLDAELPC
jgi:hypothetical protein